MRCGVDEQSQRIQMQLSCLLFFLCHGVASWGIMHGRALVTAVVRMSQSILSSHRVYVDSFETVNIGNNWFDACWNFAIEL